MSEHLLLGTGFVLFGAGLAHRSETMLKGDLYFKAMKWVMLSIALILEISMVV